MASPADMPKRRAERESACSGKKAFDSESAANKALRYVQVWGTSLVKPTRSYRCGCGKWHLTSKKGGY
jgi:hypothetical protein